MSSSSSSSSSKTEATPPTRVGATGLGVGDEAQDEERKKKNVVIFVSGGGSNFKAIHTAMLEGRIRGRVVAVVSDKTACGGITYAQSHGIPTFTYPALKKDPHTGLSPAELTATLADLETDLVVLAGYLKLVPSEVVAAYPNRMVNIHPALLPAFGGQGMHGMNVHRAVVASGARVSGPTVHFVSEEYDEGYILAQATVPVSPMDTPERVAAKVLEQEHQLFPAVVAALCEDRVTWRDDGVPILWTAQ